MLNTIGTFTILEINGDRFTCQCVCGQWEERNKTELELPCASLTHTESLPSVSRIETQRLNKLLFESVPGVEIPVPYWTSLQNRNKSAKGKTFTVSLEYIWELFLDQERKCAISKVEIWFADKKKHPNTTASLDRIDSSQGYVPGNVQWVHKIVNRMKSDLSEDELREWCTRILK